MPETSTDLGKRTFQFALRCCRLVNQLSVSMAANVVGKQLLRSSTSVGANYRAARRARSKAEFISKMGIVEEEADECVYWLELIVALELMAQNRVELLIQEANEIVAICVASIRTAKKGGTNER